MRLNYDGRHCPPYRGLYEKKNGMRWFSLLEGSLVCLTERKDNFFRTDMQSVSGIEKEKLSENFLH